MSETLRIQLIEQYLTNQLSKQDRYDLELRLMTDESLARLFSNIESALDGIRSLGRKDLLKKLKRWDLNPQTLKVEDQKDLEQLDDYLLGNLSEKESEDLERKIKEDPQLKNQLTDLEHLQKGIEYKGRKDLRKQLKRWESEQKPWKSPDEDPEKSKAKIVTFRRIASIAAAIAIIACAWYFGTGNAETNRDMASYFKVYPNTLLNQTRSDSDDLLQRAAELFPNHNSEEVKLAFQSFDAGQFEQASVQFAELTNQSPSAELQFYLGESLMVQKDYQKALKAFLLSSESGEKGLIQEQAIWFAGLCMWELEMTDALKKHWADFKEQDCNNCKQAAKILKNL